MAPFGAVPGLRCSSFPVVPDAPSLAGFLGPGRRFRLRLLGSCLVRVLQRVLDAACPCRCVARERRPGGTRPFSDCSPSSAGSFLTVFARAARGISRQAMALSCPAPSKYPGCVVELGAAEAASMASAAAVAAVVPAASMGSGYSGGAGAGDGAHRSRSGSCSSMIPASVFVVLAQAMAHWERLHVPRCPRATCGATCAAGSGPGGPSSPPEGDRGI